MPDRKRIIGLTGPSHFSNDCMEAIEELLDANFVLLYHGNQENVHFWLEQVDGVIIAGGIDIHPTIYDQSIWNNQNLSKFDLRRDCRELSIIEYCLKMNKPMLGICRGHQLLGIKYGMNLVMDISESPVCHQPQKITLEKFEPTHYVKLVDKDTFYKLYPMPQEPPERAVIRKVMREPIGERLWVNSFHHQAIAYDRKKPPAGVTVLGIARLDLDNGVKENVELMQGDNWIGCQWHPEYDWRENTASRSILERFRYLLNGGT